MPIHKSNKPMKPVDREALRKRMNTGIAILQRSIIAAMREKFVSIEVGMPINNQLSELDQAISVAFPAPAVDYESLARLPF